MKRGLCRMEHELASREDFREILDDLKARGVEGVVINHPCDDGYLKDEAGWARLNEAIDYAKDLGFNVWLYDEKGFPSGKAGTYVVQSNPDFQAKGITYLARDRIAKGEIFAFDLPDDLDEIIYVYVERGNVRFPIPFSARQVVFKDTRPNDSVHIFASRKFHEGSVAGSSGSGEKYANIMDERAARKFIEVTYEEYFRRIPNIGEKIDAFFTDEPALAEGYIYNEIAPNMWWTRGYKYANVSWRDDFAEEFSREHGYDLLLRGRDLFRGDDEESCLTRIHYRSTAARLVGEAYFSQIEKSCRAHGTRLSGHINNEEYLHEHVLYYGNLFTVLDKEDYIGTDILNGCIEELMYRDRRFIGNKFVGSLARIRGKTDVVMAELCPVRDRAYVNAAEIKAVCSYLYFCGVNYINSYYRPATDEESRNLSDYLKFLYANLGGKTKDGKIAVYYPIETMQALVKPLCVPHEDVYRSKEHVVGKIEENLRGLAENIWARGLDFEFADAAALRSAKIENGKFVIAGMEFSVLILPDIRYLPKDIFRRIRKMQESGISAVWLGGQSEIILFEERGRKIARAKVTNAPYECFESAAVKAAKNKIRWTSKDKFLYAEFLQSGKITGMFVNNDGIFKTIRFPRGAKLTAARFTGNEAANEAVNGSLAVAPYETVFVTKR